jgi:phage terminase small subunit
MSAEVPEKKPKAKKTPRKRSPAAGKGRGVADQLTEKQVAFCREYLVDLNATAAAVRAGYSEATANQQGPRLLGDDRIQEEIQRLMGERSQRVEVKADRVVEELAAMAFYDPGVLGAANPQSPADIAALPEEVRRAIVGWSYDRAGRFTIRLAAKTTALELIGRHLKMFTDRTEHTGPDGESLNQAVGLSAEQLAAIEHVRQIREAEMEKRA